MCVCVIDELLKVQLKPIYIYVGVQEEGGVFTILKATIINSRLHSQNQRHIPINL